MTHTQNIWKTLLGTAALSVVMSSAAYAGGTAAGTVVSNDFTLNYSVNTVAQPEITPPSTTDFTVDRRIDLTSAGPGSAIASNPNQADIDIEFTFVNEGNDATNFTFGASDNGGDATLENPTVVSYWIDTDGNGSQGGGEPTVTYNPGDEPVIQPDLTVHINVQADVESGANNGETGALLFTATATNGSGTVLTTSPTNTLAGEETYVDDGSGATDADDDAVHTAIANFTISAAAITGQKVAAIVTTDGSNCTDFATAANTAANFAVPGACVEYTITVTNAPGSADATDIEITDVLADELVLIAINSSNLGGSFTSPASIPTGGIQCNGAPAAPASPTCNIVYSGGALTGGTSGEIVIRALVEANP